MTPRLVLRPQAEAELLDARAWYEEQRPGLGSTFATEIDGALSGILEAPRNLDRGDLRGFRPPFHCNLAVARIESDGNTAGKPLRRRFHERWRLDALAGWRRVAFDRERHAPIVRLALPSASPLHETSTRSPRPSHSKRAACLKERFRPENEPAIPDGFRRPLRNDVGVEIDVCMVDLDSNVRSSAPGRAGGSPGAPG